MELQEKDWKIFRKKIPKWQEAYMEKLVGEYALILSSSERGSSKFWDLEKRIKEDKKSPGVIISPRRSQLYNDIIQLFVDGAITMDDLEDFSEEFQDYIKSLLERMNLI